MTRPRGLRGVEPGHEIRLARQVISAGPRTAAYYDLENPEDMARLEEPMLALEAQRGLVVIDEVQRLPELFPVLRVLADRRPRPARFLVLGSDSTWFMRASGPSPLALAYGPSH